MSNLIDELGEALDKHFHDVIVEGEVARDSKGEIIFNEDGSPLRCTPSAAMSSAASRWYEKRIAEQGGHTTQDMLDLAEAAATAPGLVHQPGLHDDDGPITHIGDFTSAVPGEAQS